MSELHKAAVRARIIAKVKAARELIARPRITRDFFIYRHDLLNPPFALRQTITGDLREMRAFQGPSAVSCNGRVSGIHQSTYELRTWTSDMKEKPSVTFLVNYPGLAISVSCVFHPLYVFGSCACFFHCPLLNFGLFLPDIQRPLHFNWHYKRNHLILQIHFDFQREDYLGPPIDPTTFQQKGYKINDEGQPSPILATRFRSTPCQPRSRPATTTTPKSSASATRPST